VVVSIKYVFLGVAGLVVAAAGAFLTGSYLLAHEYRTPFRLDETHATPRMQALLDIAAEAERRANLPPPRVIELTPEAERGKEVFAANGCIACHTVTGQKKVGPSLLNVFGTEQPLVGGTTILADDVYMRESILTPQAKVVEGYVSNMPSYAELISAEDLDDLIEYLRCLGPAEG
jgi:cytochrome c2